MDIDGNEGEKCSFILDLVTGIDLGTVNRGKIEWIGCPVIPDQVLYAIQKGVIEIDPTWTPLPQRNQ